MGNRKSKITTAVIDKPIVSTPKESQAPALIVESTVSDVVVTGSNAVEEPPVEEPPVEEPPVPEPTVSEPTVPEPTVPEPTVPEVVVTEPVGVADSSVVEEPAVAEQISAPILDSIQEVDEHPEAEAHARPTVKSDSSRSLKITFMSASHDPYAYLPKKEQPETKSKHGKKFKKHHAKMEAEKMVDPPSSTNMDEMD